MGAILNELEDLHIFIVIQCVVDGAPHVFLQVEFIFHDLLKPVFEELGLDVWFHEKFFVIEDVTEGSLIHLIILQDFLVIEIDDLENLF